MISDPDDPDFRFPQSGERYFHAPWEQWCVVMPQRPEIAHLVPRDEVLVYLIRDCKPAIVKLKSLEVDS